MVSRWPLTTSMVSGLTVFNYCTHSKVEVEKASPGSVVHIDRHTVQFEKNGQIRSRECFRRVFVSFKACWEGFLDGCRPYLAVEPLHSMVGSKDN